MDWAWKRRVKHVVVGAVHTTWRRAGQGLSEYAVVMAGVALVVIILVTLARSAVRVVQVNVSPSTARFLVGAEHAHI